MLKDEYDKLVEHGRVFGSSVGSIEKCQRLSIKISASESFDGINAWVWDPPLCEECMVHAKVFHQNVLLCPC